MILWVVGGVILVPLAMLWGLIKVNRKDATEDAERAAAMKNLMASQKTTERMQDVQSRPATGDAARKRMRDRDPNKR